MKKKLWQSPEFAENIINTVREPLIALDQDLRVVTVSRSFYEFFQVKPKETVGQLIYDLGNKQWDIPKLRELLEDILPEKTTFDNYEVEHDFATIGRRTMLLNARQIEQALGKERIILLAIEDITERKVIESGLETTRKELEVVKKIADAAHEFAESLINTVREPLISLDQDLRVVTVSRSFYDFFKVKPEDTVGQLIYDLGNKQWNIPKLRELLEDILPEQTTFDNYEVEHDFATIGRRTMLLNARQIEQGRGKERIILLAIEDITERKKTEEKLKYSLKEQTVMLKEIHHRVKNNLTVVYSMLDLQAKSIADESTCAKLEESRDRVLSMALIHEQLYQSGDLAHVDFKEYLQSLVNNIAGTYNRPEVMVSVDMEPVALDVNRGIPCGLIVNELVTNCLKYAFPAGRKGIVSVGISINSEGDYVLFVEDNGIGFPTDIDFQNTSSLGLELVNGLTKQIRGKIELSNESGTRFKITFRSNPTSGGKQNG
jgi:PAS domain S-box-containing protein